jgi:hypothetical protein
LFGQNFSNPENLIVRVRSVTKAQEEVRVDTSIKQILAGSRFFISDKAHILTVASIAKNAQMIRIDYMGSSDAAKCIEIDVQTNFAILRLL